MHVDIYEWDLFVFGLTWRPLHQTHDLSKVKVKE